MSQTDERRVVGERRISLEKVVDVCVGESGQTGAFQARTLDISGRGMHLRTDRVPELSGPLVFRFHAAGGEILAEGEVVWRSEGSEGCDFGVRFTALDGGSAQALQKLCGSAGSIKSRPIETVGHASSDHLAAELSSEPAADDNTPTAWTQVKPVVTGNSKVAAVRLHIEGMAQPLRAVVRESGPGRLSVGSSLEFLSIGSAVEIENVKTNERHTAEIGDVNVRVDPKSQVPELLVSVRYPQGTGIKLGGAFFDEPSARQLSQQLPNASSNCGPSAEDSQPEVAASSSFAFTAKANMDVAVQTGAAEATELSSDTSELHAKESHEAEFDDSQGNNSESEDDEREETGPLEALGRGVSDGVNWAARQGGLVSGLVGQGAGWATSRASKLLPSSRLAPKSKATPLRRTTAAVPRRVGTERGRRQGLRFEERDPAGRGQARVSPGRGRARLAIAAIVVTASVGAWLSTGDSLSGLQANSSPPVDRQLSSQGKVASKNSSKTKVPAAQRSLESKDAVGSSTKPLSVPASASKTTEKSTKRVSVAGKPAIARRSPDRTVSRSKSVPIRKAKGSSSTVSSTVFSRGRLHLPIVHRIRLDSPGASLIGKTTLTGFEVSIPNRKVIGSGAEMERRDSRIAKVSVSNRGGSAKISVRFHRAIPHYKVRLRKGYVELFISAK